MHKNNKLIALVFILIIIAFGYVYINPPNITGAAIQKCTDKDNSNYLNWDDDVSHFVKGYVKYKRAIYKTNYDTCKDSKTVKENYCERGLNKIKEITCPKDSICKTDEKYSYCEIPCQRTKSKNGIPGYVLSEGIKTDDYCSSNNRLIKMTCYKNRLLTQQNVCENGCLGGICA